MTKEIVYSDPDISFKCHPVTGNIILRKDKAAIAQSLKNLILLNRYEDLFNPDISTDVSASLFELIDDVSLVFIRQKIETTIQNYEPRATLLEVKYYRDKNTPNGFVFSILYLPQNAIEPETVDIFLERIR